MGFLNYNIIFDIDISNYETDYVKIRHNFWSRVVLEWFLKKKEKKGLTGLK
jgi:hypothetical protein